MFSSVAVEATAFDAHTSLMGEKGRTAFGPQIGLGFMRFTPTRDTLLGHIQERLASPRTPVNDDFIDMRPEVADRALEALLRRPNWGARAPFQFLNVLGAMMQATFAFGRTLP